MPRHKMVAAIPDRYQDVVPVKAHVEKHGDEYIVTSPNLFDNLVISTGATVRVEPLL